MSALLQMPCLGRPFNLGMLYDCHHDKFIPGKTLWDSTVLRSALQTSAQPSSEFEIFAEDSLHKKCQSLNIEGEQKLSMLGGILEVGGAAKFMHDQTSSTRQCRVTLKYSCTTRFDQLTMEQLGSIQYPQVLDDHHATHVVTGIMYGADAFFVFDREVSESETVKKVTGNMEGQIKLIPTGGSASVDTECVDETETEKFHCKFHGDLIISNPSTYDKAVQVYRELPNLFKLNSESGDRSVPKSVYLYPLSELDGKPEQMVRSISRELISQVEEIMESLHQAEMKCNDLKKRNICSKFTDQKDQITTFARLVTRFKMDFTKQLSLLIPKIRSSKADEQELMELVASVCDSPFFYEHMENYLKTKEKETKRLFQYLKNIDKDDKIQFDFPNTDCDLLILTADDEIENIVCFAFNFDSDTMPDYIKNLQIYLKTGKTGVSTESWFGKPIIFDHSKAKKLVKAYTDFVSANSETKGLVFVVTNRSEEINASGPAVMLYDDDSWTEIELPCRPEIPEVSKTNRDSVVLTWTKPDRCSPDITSYNVLCHSSMKGIDVSQYQCLVGKGLRVSFQMNELSPSREYKFQVQAVTKIGVSVLSDICSATTDRLDRPADIMKKQSTLIAKGKPAVYQLPVKTIGQNPSLGLFKKIIGQSTRPEKPERVLMLVGATGAGKTTLINGIANYILGVEWKDDFRFKVISDEGKASQIYSQTQSITAYTFHSTIVPYRLTLIDTPGFGDTSGIEGDKRIEKKIQHFFSTRGDVSIEVLHGIGFVTQAGLARLTPTQRYVFDAVFCIFSKDIADAIFLMATFADANTPTVLEATKAAGIPCKAFFKFNNSALFASNETADCEDINAMFWVMGQKSLKIFFANFAKVEARSLFSTREVLKEREQLETLIPGLQQQVRVGLSHLDEIEQEENALKQHEAEIAANEDFTYTVEIPKPRKLPLPNTVTTTCLTCNFTCHKVCAYENDSDKRRCSAMRGDNCTVCPNKCHWEKHANLPYHIEYYTVSEVRTYSNLKERYETAKTGKEKVESMIAKNEGMLNQLQSYVFSMIDTIRRSVKKLDEIALKPNPLTEIDYLNILIASEEAEAQRGWQSRVKQYMKMRKDAEMLKKVQQMATKPAKGKSWWKFGR